MTIKSIASGSSGNCYKISDGQTALLIECGLPLKKIKEKLNYTTSDLSGCLISHEHGDHSKSVKDLIKSGIDIYTSEKTAEALGIEKSHRFIKLRKHIGTKIGTLTIYPFDVSHDAVDPLGFMVDSDGERLIFLTDTIYSRYLFSDMTILMIECNYDIETLDRKVSEGKLNQALRDRIRQSHMSLDQVIEFLKANDLSKLKEVYLMHLSDSNSDEKLMKKRVQEVTGVPVHVL